MSVFFLSHDITIRRLRRTSGYSSNFSTTYTHYQADIQPTDVNRGNQDGRIGVKYEMFVEYDNPVKEGDQVVSNGATYSVQSVNIYQGAGLLDHKHVIMVTQNASN